MKLFLVFPIVSDSDDECRPFKIPLQRCDQFYDPNCYDPYGRHSTSARSSAATSMLNYRQPSASTTFSTPTFSLLSDYSKQMSSYSQRKLMINSLSLFRNHHPHPLPHLNPSKIISHPFTSLPQRHLCSPPSLHLWLAYLFPTPPSSLLPRFSFFFIWPLINKTARLSQSPLFFSPYSRLAFLFEKQNCMARYAIPIPPIHPFFPSDLANHCKHFFLWCHRVHCSSNSEVPP